MGNATQRVVGFVGSGVVAGALGLGGGTAVEVEACSEGARGASPEIGEGVEGRGTSGGWRAWAWSGWGEEGRGVWCGGVDVRGREWLFFLAGCSY